jgi:hypothetical protein
MKKFLMVSALGLSVVLASCSLFLKGTKVDLPGNNPVGLNGSSLDVGVSGASRPELMSNRAAVVLQKAITPATFGDATGISSELNKYGITVSSLSAWGACIKFSGTAVLKNNTAPIPAVITLSDVSADLNLSDPAVPAGVSFTLKTNPANASVALNNQTGTNNYTFAANQLELCAKIEGANLVQLIGILEGGGTNTVSGVLKYSLDGVGGLTIGSSLTLIFADGTSYIIL